jgi:hypothetical protein
MAVITNVSSNNGVLKNAEATVCSVGHVSNVNKTEAMVPSAATVSNLNKIEAPVHVASRAALRGLPMWLG